MEEKLSLAIQKSGRLSEKSLNLVKECGIKFSSSGSGRLKTVGTNFPIEVLFLRDDDIPGYVEDGVAQIGIVGENVAVEKGKAVEMVKRLGFSRCRLSLAVPRNVEYPGVKYFSNRNIATSYPKLLGDYLQKEGVVAEIHEISGSVEIAPSIGLADGVCDIVSSGSTLLSNGLKEVEVIFKSEAVMVGSQHLSPTQQRLLNELLFRIDAVQKGHSNRYILLNAPNESIDTIVNLLPGMRSPTVLPLANKGWSSIHSVVNEDKFWEVIDQLKEAGAEGILVVPVEKMIS
jgi:ATP phosphoribosyltransferase